VIATSEYELVTESAGLLKRPGRAMFAVRGGDAADFLQGQVSNDVESLSPGQGCYATILNHKGKLRTDLRVLRGADYFWLDTEAIGHAVLRHMLDTYSLGRDVRWEDVGESHTLLSLIGPAADDLIDPPPPAEEHSFVDSGAGLWSAPTSASTCSAPPPARRSCAPSSARRRCPRRWSSACASSPGARASGSTWMRRRSRRRPASTSGP
jgi:folate-binding Fe-S cluster repair protein YgfZ